MAELEILGMPQSNFVWVCRIAATEKGVPYKLIPARPHTPQIDAIHPFGQMPAMRHGDFTLFESKAICTYIDRAFPGPALIPADVKQAAQTEQWISAVNTSIDPLCVRQFLLGYIFPGTPDGSPDRKKIDAALPKLKTQLGVLEKATGNGHLVGSSFTLADAFLMPILYYLSKTPEGGEGIKAHKALSAYLARHIERASIKGTLPPPMPGK